MSDPVAANFRNRVIELYGFLITVTIAAWVSAFVAFGDNPALLGTALLAFTLGLRHAVDADHIAAIDNLTRKLMQQGKRPLSVGLFFSLGHSTVVLLASFAIFLTATALERRINQYKELGAVVGTSISALFLAVIALMNFAIFRGVYRTFQEVKNGGSYPDPKSEDMLEHGGVMARVFKPIFRILSKSWHMYPLGFLFGLGFDTATEVALFGISAAAVVKGLTVSSMMIFPLLFAAGMILVDTTDGILMVGAYGWAFVKPIRKLYYNLTITFLSVLVALCVGGIEVIGLLKERLRLNGGFWDLIGGLNDNFSSLGCVIIGLFILSWSVAILLYRMKGYDQLARKNHTLRE
jgi:high-affinity nickel-transport protein